MNAHQRRIRRRRNARLDAFASSLANLSRAFEGVREAIRVQQTVGEDLVGEFGRMAAIARFRESAEVR